MRDHPLVRFKSLTAGVGYDEAEDLVRGEARRGDAAAKKAVDEIDAARAREKTEAAALNKRMAATLGLTAEQVAGLVKKLVESPELETWLLRRVNLYRAHEAPPADDSHPENA